MPEASRIKSLQRQTYESRSIEFKSFFARVANLGSVDPPPRIETAAPTGIGSGGKAGYKNAGKRLPDFYRTHPILAMHFGLGDGR